jgi:hypothetical protein
MFARGKPPVTLLLETSSERILVHRGRGGRRMLDEHRQELRDG